MTESAGIPEIERFAAQVEKFAAGWAAEIGRKFEPFAAAVADAQPPNPRSTGGHLIPDHLRFPPLGEKYTAAQVIQQSIEAYMNGGRHGNAREPLADFIANELRLHGWEL